LREKRDWQTWLKMGQIYDIRWLTNVPCRSNHIKVQSTQNLPFLAKDWRKLYQYGFSLEGKCHQFMAAK
jgi:hypothetical protein